MVKEAEEFAEEDKKLREKVEARNSLESIAYSLRNQVGDKEKLGAKLTDEDKEKITQAVNEAIQFLDDNPNAEKEEYDEAKEKLQSVTNPIIQRVYQQQGAPAGEDTATDADEGMGDL